MPESKTRIRAEYLGRGHVPRLDATPSPRGDLSPCVYRFVSDFYCHFLGDLSLANRSPGWTYPPTPSMEERSTTLRDLECSVSTRQASAHHHRPSNTTLSPNR